MKKPLLKSTTTQSVAAAGAITATALSVADILGSAIPPDSPWANPAVTAFLTFLANTFILPFISRQLARWRGK